MIELIKKTSLFEKIMYVYILTFVLEFIFKQYSMYYIRIGFNVNIYNEYTTIYYKYC